MAHFFGKSDNGISVRLCDSEYELRVMIFERMSLSTMCMFLPHHTSIAPAATNTNDIFPFKTYSN